MTSSSFPLCAPPHSYLFNFNLSSSSPFFFSCPVSRSHLRHTQSSCAASGPPNITRRRSLGTPHLRHLRSLALITPRRSPRMQNTTARLPIARFPFALAQTRPHCSQTQPGNINAISSFLPCSTASPRRPSPIAVCCISSLIGLLRDGVRHDRMDRQKH